MAEPIPCRNCGEPIHWSLDFRRWVHEQPKVRYCVKNFDADKNPTTEAEPGMTIKFNPYIHRF